jgi:hypothetical protein
MHQYFCKRIGGKQQQQQQRGRQQRGGRGGMQARVPRGIHETFAWMKGTEWKWNNWREVSRKTHR